MRPSLRMVLCGLLAAAGGCREQSECSVVREEVIADHEPTPEGVTVVSVLEVAGPPRDVVVNFDPMTSNVTSGSQVAGTIALERLDEPAMYVVTTQSGNTESDLGCGPALVIPVQLVLQTDDGALDDGFISTVDYDTRLGVPQQGSTITFSSDFDFDELEGWLRPLVGGGTGELSASFGTEAVGELGARHESSSHSDSKEAFVPLATWNTGE